MQSRKKMFQTVTKFLLVLLAVGASLGVLSQQKAQAATRWGVLFVSFAGDYEVNGEGTVVMNPTTHETQYVWGGQCATRPANPTRAGYTFDNWYTDQTYTTPFNFSTPINASISVWGRWLKSIKFKAHDESTGNIGGGKITVSGTFPGTSATQVGNSAFFTQNLYESNTYTFIPTANSGYYFKGWSFNDPSNGPVNYTDFTISPMWMSGQYGEINTLYAVFGKMGTETQTWNAYEGETSNFRKEYSVSGSGMTANGLYILEDNNHITQTRWEGLTADGKLPASGNAKFIITLKGNPAVGSYPVVFYDNVSHKIINATIVVKHRVQKWLPVAATCTTAGYNTYWECLECGKCFSDEACTTETTKEAMQVPALEHNYGNWQYLNATQHRHYCSHNTAHYETRNHTWNDGVITAQPTTTAEGVKTYTCTGCGGTKTESIPKISNVVVTINPIDYIGIEGSKARFTVVATGEGLTYQWQYSDDDGTTWNNSSVRIRTYSTTLTKTKNNRMLRCIVSDGYGNSAISDAARMRIQYPPVITEQPVDYVGPNQSKPRFAVVATGEGLSYQWQYSDDDGRTWNNSSVKISTYSTTLTTARNNRMLRCIVSDGYGNSVISDAARMRIHYPLVITEQPVDYVGPNQSKPRFAVVATGEGLSYQWQYSDDDGTTWNNSSVKIRTYSTTLTTAKNNRMLRCIVLDGYGNSVISNAVRMTIHNPLEITE